MKNVSMVSIFQTQRDERVVPDSACIHVDIEIMTLTWLTALVYSRYISFAMGSFPSKINNDGQL